MDSHCHLLPTNRYWQSLTNTALVVLLEEPTGCSFYYCILVACHYIYIIHIIYIFSETKDTSVNWAIECITLVRAQTLQNFFPSES